MENRWKEEKNDLNRKSVDFKMNLFKKLTVIWLTPLILLTVTSTSYGYHNETEHQIVSLAESLIGKPFKQGGNTPQEGFDSTGFVQYVFREEDNIVLPGSPSQLWKLGEPIEQSEIHPGDVLFFTGSSNRIPAIYKGDDIIVVVATNEGVVKRNIIEDSYWRDRYQGARRYTNIEESGSVSNPIVEKAMDLLETPYHPKGKSPTEGFNTTNFVRYVFQDVLDVQLSVFADRIYEAGESISKEDLQPGDLVFFRGSSLIPGIYRGNGMFIVQTTDGVAERDMESEYWSDIYKGAKRRQEDGKTHHAAIYLGNDYIIHASGDEGMTAISYLGQYLLDRYLIVKRFDSLSLKLDSKVVEEAYQTLDVPYLFLESTICWGKTI